MRDFLSEYINTLSSARRRRVYDIMAAAKIDKADLDRLSAKLQEIKLGAPLVVNPEAPGARLEVGKLETIYRDTIQKLMSLYEASNLVSLMLDTHTSILNTEIQAMDSDITAMQKAMDNYAFMLADNGAYDFAYLETFNDDTMRSTSDAMVYTDRNGVDFSPDEQAYVNSAGGTLTLSPAVDVSYNLTGRIVGSNCAAFITSDTGIDNAFKDEVGSGWRVAVSSPRPISATLGTQTRQGAQFELEIHLTTPSPSDAIVVTPFADRPFEILLLEVFISKENEEVSKLTLVQEPYTIDKPADFGFPLNTISRIKMIVNQPVYQRGQVMPVESEEIYRSLTSAVKAQQELAIEEDSQRNYRRNKKALTDAFLYTINKSATKDETTIFRAKLPAINFDPDRGPMNIVNLTRNERLIHGQEDLWKSKSVVNNIFRRMMHEKVLSSNANFIGGKALMIPGRQFFGNSDELNKMFKSGSLEPQPEGVAIDSNVDGIDFANYSSNAKFLDYEYDLGFRNIQIGRGQRIFRGVFVTKPLPADSDSGEVKIKTDDINYEAYNSDKQSKIVTSIEYSITNVSDPREESDWIPILPVNEATQVLAERVFFRENGSAFTRFPISRQGEIRVYRNGYLLNNETTVPLTMIPSEDNQSILGIKLPLASIQRDDIFTIDYYIYGDQTRVNFVERGFEQTNLATAYDTTGAGQTFAGTQTGRTVALTNSPYIDYVAAQATGSYSRSLGYVGSYQPISVVMADGSIAYNQTNYIGNIQNDLTNFPSGETAYVQSGKNITFNKIITEQFTVYYQYLPSNLKARIVLRVNDVSYVGPQVNSIQIKSKMRIADARRGL